MSGAKKVFATAVLVVLAGTPNSLGAKRIRLTDPSTRDVYFPVEVNGWWGAMNQVGSLVIYPQYEWSDHVYNGWVRIVVEGKTGYVRSALRGDRDPDKSRLIIKPQYEYGDRFQEKFAVVGNAGRFGFIDVNGRPRTKMEFDAALRFKDGVAAVRIKDQCGFIDTSGKISISLEHARVRSFHEGLAVAATARGELGYINRAGKYTWRDKSRRIEDLGDFHDGLARAQTGSKWGFLDKRGRLQIPAVYDEARDFHGGLAAVRAGTKWGYINKRGRWAVKPRFESADDFDDTLALVRLEGAYGFTDKTGRLRIPAQFADAHPFFRRYARVWTDTSHAYVDTAGNVVWDPRLAAEGFVDITKRPRAISSGVTTQRQVVSRTGYKSELILPPQPRVPVLPPPYPPDHEYEEQLALPPPPADE